MRILPLLLLAVAAIAADPAALTVAAWDCGSYKDGGVAPLGVGGRLAGEGTPVTIGVRKLLALAHGQAVTAALESGPLASGKPVAIEIGFIATALPDGYHGGLVEAGSYSDRGVRIMYQHDQRISVEHFTGKDPVYLVSPGTVALNTWTALRYEHDGVRARLLLDGKVVAQAECAPAAPWSGTLRIGSASGDQYNFNGAIGTVRILAIATAAK